MALRRVLFYRALHRPHLLFGGERELVLFVTVIAVWLPVNGQNWPAVGVGVLIWTVAMPVLRWAAKYDPQFSKVYRRHLKWRKHYPARARPYRDAKRFFVERWYEGLFPSQARPPGDY